MGYPESSEVTQAIETATEGGGEGQGSPDLAPSPVTTHAPLTELEKLEKFKFDGQELTPQELRKAMLRQQDYTRKTQEFSQERKFYDNLSADLRSVRANPALASEFRRIYPEKFHAYLEHVSVQSQGTPSTTQPEQQGGNKPQYAQLDPDTLSRLERIENINYEKEVSSIETSLEAQEKEFQAKYPMSDLETVYARAQAIVDKNRSLPKEEQIQMDKATWEKLYKMDHEKNQKRYENYYKTNINKQKQAGLKGRDSGVGGGMPGGAPKTYKSIKEATEAALADLDS